MEAPYSGNVGEGVDQVIDRREILDTAAQTSLTPHVVEKDYVLGWILAGIFWARRTCRELDIQRRHLPQEMFLRDLSIFRRS